MTKMEHANIFAYSEQFPLKRKCPASRQSLPQSEYTAFYSMLRISHWLLLSFLLGLLYLFLGVMNLYHERERKHYYFIFFNLIFIIFLCIYSIILFIERECILGILGSFTAIIL